MTLGSVCYIDNGKEILLLYRNKKENDIHEGKWIGVGGKLEQGETPEECIIREVYEETGLHIVNPTIRGMITFPMFDGVTDWYVFVFTASQFSGCLIDSPEGTLEWVPYQEVLNKPTWQGDTVFLQWLMDKTPFFSAKMVYGKDNQLIERKEVFHG